MCRSPWVDLAICAALATSCGSSSSQAPPSTKSGGMVTPEGGASNVPPPPNVDRTKCDKSGKQVVTVDTNQDKNPDVWKFYVPVQQGSQTIQQMTCKIIDLNHDGKVDVITVYDSDSRPEKEEYDMDFDGQNEMVTYFQQGRRVRTEVDLNFDRRPDVWKYYENDKLVRIERDRNGDGRVDEWQYYEGGKLDRIGYDTSGAGKVDRWDRAPEGAGEDETGTVPAVPKAPAPGEGGAAPAPAPTTAPAASPAPTAGSKKAAKK